MSKFANNTVCPVCDKAIHVDYRYDVFSTHAPNPDDLIECPAVNFPNNGDSGSSDLAYCYYCDSILRITIMHDCRPTGCDGFNVVVATPEEVEDWKASLAAECGEESGDIGDVVSPEDNC
jgi:hypothetical protein